MSVFENVKKNFGFGCMRLPMKDGDVDKELFCEMIDTFMQNGFNYFDTARGYLGGKSEKALCECLSKRYPRESFILVDKLTDDYFMRNEDIIPFFESQLEACGVDYFDFYLMHAQDKRNFEKFKKCRAYETAFKLKQEGKIKHVGMSFHDKAEVLDRILTEYPEIEVVQIQFNYADYNDPSVQGKQCYEVCRKHNKPIIVMEPVKGGSLVKLPDAACDIIKGMNGGSAASYAIRYAASFEGIFMVLSGMGDMDMLRDNIGFMKDFKPLESDEFKALERICDILSSLDSIPCTACRYCTDGCPAKIDIPSLFACLNDKKVWNDWNPDVYYDIHTQNGGKASDCIACGKCEKVCPQHLEIRKLLKTVAAEFEK